MNASNDLLKIIEETQYIIDSLNSLSSPVSKEEEFEHINQLVVKRETFLHDFFEQHTTETLETLVNQLNRLIELDEEMTETAVKIRKEMTRKVIQQKKNIKAKNIYQNM